MSRIISKYISLILSIVMLFTSSFISVFAEEDATELITNGTFETISSKTDFFEGWDITDGMSICKDEAHDGQYSLRMASEENHFIGQVINNIKGGTDYVLSAYFKWMGAKNPAKLQIRFQEPSGNTFKDLDSAINLMFPANADGWQQVSETITAPKNATRAVLLIAASNGARDVCVDDVSLLGESTAVGNTQDSDEVADTFYGDNLVPNASFEDLTPDGKMPALWDVRSEYIASTSQKEARTGNSSIMLTTEGGGAINPFASQVIDGIYGDTEYQYTAWVKVEKLIDGSSKSHEGIPLETYFYTADGTRQYIGGIGAMQQVVAKIEPTGWTKIVNRFKTPVACNSLTVFVRLYGYGTLYFDDVSLHMVNEPGESQLSTDWVFYYSHWAGNGEATLTANTSFFPELEGGNVEFSFKDGDEVLLTGNDKIVSKEAKFTYPLSLLSEKQKEYIIEAKIVDNTGKERITQTAPVYKYDRPNYLNENGDYLVNGEPLDIYFGMSSAPEDYPLWADIGVNVVNGQLLTRVEEHIRFLDAALENGIMLTLPLYNNMLPAGHPDNIEFTKAVVEACKDHPALFGYNIADEPFLRPTVSSEMMRESYKIIRDIDPNHPIYTTEAMTSYYREASKYVDILGHDPYGTASSMSVTTRTTKAYDDTMYKKPVWNVLQTFNNNAYFPAPDELRHTIYQSLLCGARGIAFYGLRAGMNDGRKTLAETELWPVMNDFAKNERDLMYDHFVYGKYPIFNENRNGDYWYHAFVKDSEIYLITLNNKDYDVSVEIPLTACDGSISLGDFTSEVFAGAESGRVKGNGAFTTTLSKNQVVVYRIKPENTIDFSGLTETRFTDLGYHPWAKEQISELDRLGIVNDFGSYSYVPGKNITRADFAVYLIRTLGLSNQSVSGESFSDVPSTAYYAKEISIGKELGLLKGTGDNKYNPEASISRQDLMTICARGLSYVNKVTEDENIDNLNVFSDASMIADYAVSSVSAMVRDGIIEGNANGTVNPLGNTTRAEAAVIMYRILNK